MQCPPRKSKHAVIILCHISQYKVNCFIEVTYLVQSTCLEIFCQTLSVAAIDEQSQSAVGFCSRRLGRLVKSLPALYHTAGDWDFVVTLKVILEL